MKWIRVRKIESNKPNHGKTYSDWKQALADEGRNQCVYCAIPESRYGGLRNFHVEHFRPKSLGKFKRLINEWRNLFFACSICNTFKSNDWIINPKNNGSVLCYIDPSKANYSDMIDVNVKTGEIAGKNIAISFMIEKLFLNRPQLQFERRQSYLSSALSELSEYTTNISEIITEKKDGELDELFRGFCVLLIESMEIDKKLMQARPYEDKDVKRN